ncbi:thiosulfate oxidation carrier complex protein SoxZ [Thiohalocapsa marina]|uniref:Thiosulfate oxidation carrier complex protein SoxZ n=1 Tax=Thiohalocapsa marina TaxID=424902 RepID=A0A5M8FVE5_9GAMM|nr:thiosulfate oxidation carrier complex protein SoxZ [Thiohalocapsa marina]KAA6187798.1 thiosulfate oxidation carrier complex protein SoxZ [Thiohalocapsa marina]
MPEDNGKIRARLRDGVADVKILMRHPMETGRRKDPESGELIPKHYIREVICEHNGQVAMRLDWSWGISADPYLAFKVKDAQVGDAISVRWTDDQGQTATLSAQLS